jgi:hypothetical protein
MLWRPSSADTEYMGGAVQDILPPLSAPSTLTYCRAESPWAYRWSADIGYAAERALRVVLYRSG